MKTKKLIISALFIAIATVLSLIKLFALPFGGSVTLVSMMPIILLAYMFGTKWGLLCGFIYSLLQMLTGMDVVSALFLPGDSQMLVWQAISVCLIDYVLAYTMLGFGGIFKGKFKNEAASVALGTLVAMLLTYLMHIISGYIFYGAWAEWFFTQEGFYSFGKTIMENCSGAGLSLVYSLIYNGLYMIPETIITVIVTPIVYKAVKKAAKI